MTRSQLLPLEGQLVHTSGVVGSICQRNENHYDMVLQNVEVRPIDHSVPLLTIEPVIVDHLWKIFPPKLFEPGKHLSGLGYVRWYTRTDGTCDLGVTTIPSLNLANVIDELAQAAANGDWSERQCVARSAALIESQLKDREAFLVSEDMSVRDLFAMFRKANDRLELDRQKNFKALFGDWSTRWSRRNPPQPQPTVCIPFL